MKKLFYILILLFYVQSISADNQIVSLGTGGVTGVYYPTGGSICRIVNKSRLSHGMRCVLEETQGSVSNITRVLDGSLDLGLAQSNWIDQYHRLQQAENITNNLTQNIEEKLQLRTLLVLYPEYFTVIVPEHSTIQTFDDIKGKRISMGPSDSSLRATMIKIMEKKNWSEKDFEGIINLAPAMQAAALCDGVIDVMIYTVGHPSAAVREATQDCNSRLVSVQGTAIKELIIENSYFRWATIPGALYKGNIKSVKTFGVNATLFTSNFLSEKIAYELVKATFERFNEFRSLHPAFVRLDPEQMVKGPFAAPLHKGAIKYFKEIGLM